MRTAPERRGVRPRRRLARRFLLGGAVAVLSIGACASEPPPAPAPAAAKGTWTRALADEAPDVRSGALRLTPDLRAAASRFARDGRLDPASRARLDLAGEGAGVPSAGVFVRTRGNALAGALAAGLEVFQVTSGGILLGRIRLDRLEDLGRVPGVVRVEPARPAEPSLDLSVPSKSLPGIWSANVDLDGEDGTGVVVGMVDSGVDWRHEDFADPVTGKSRIAYLWDQTDCWDTSPPKGGSKGGYACNDTTNCGTEYTAQHIDCMLDPKGKGCSSLLDVEAWDEIAHGTHVMGTAAGNGEADGKHRGVAPGATIVAVQFDFPGWCGRNSTISILEGVRYVFERAEALGMPAVVNLSLGVGLGPHSGETLLEEGIDELVGPGRIVVAAAGNDARNGHPDNVGELGYPIHGSGTLFEGAATSFTFEVPSIAGGGYWWGNYLTFDVWFSWGAAASAKVTVTPPTGSSVTAAPGTDKCSTSGTAGSVCIYNSGLDPYAEATGTDNELWITVEDGWYASLQKGKWKVTLEGVDLPGTKTSFDVWMSASPGLVATKGVYPDGAADNRKTVGAPATADGVIAAAAHTTRNTWKDFQGKSQGYGVSGSIADYTGPMPVNEVAFFSSRGPRRGEPLQKPDVSAPGAGIAAAFSGWAWSGWYSSVFYPGRIVDDGPKGNGVSGYAVLEGTSMASPHVAGAVALMLAIDPALDPDGVREVLQGSSADVGKPGADDDHGWGRLDVEAALALVVLGCEDGVEVCNGKDDDCDGQADEGLTNACGGCSVLPVAPGSPCGDCGTVACSGKEAVTCQGSAKNACGTCGAPPAEVCNGDDDDCDGKTDEGLGEVSCGLGACHVKAPSCVDGVPTPCVPLAAGVESCGNGVDEDCDGKTDESGQTTCGGCKPLAGEPGTSCGDCGLWACDGAEKVVCVDPGPNACGECGPAPAEVCNGEDDDCDGGTDEGLGTVTCGTGACAVTVPACDAGGDPVCVPGEPGNEVCANQQDDDCDGQTDESDDNPCGGCSPLDADVGAPCGDCGVIVCLGFDAAACSDPGLNTCGGCGPVPVEVCDGLDQDCDGDTDEGLGETTCGQSDCQVTMPNCLDGKPTKCEPLPRSDDLCGNGLDEDCDGETDEDGLNACGGCPALGGAPGEPCGACGTFACEGPDALACLDPGANACGGCGEAPVEACNGIDDDCDGETDDGIGTITCGKSDCEVTVAACSGGVSQVCRPLPREDEVCGDGIDNDCDGATDDIGVNACGGCALLPEEPGAACGLCGAGVVTCTGPDEVACEDPGLNPCGACGPTPTEACNGLDDDCDGDVDEDLGTTSCGVGACHSVVPACQGGKAATCTPLAPAAEETCSNLVDDDCDGFADDGCDLVVCPPPLAMTVLKATFTLSDMEIDCEVAAPETAALLLLLDGDPPAYEMLWKPKQLFWKARFDGVAEVPETLRIESPVLGCHVDVAPEVLP